jgi:hypothetical protein
MPAGRFGKGLRPSMPTGHPVIRKILFGLSESKTMVRAIS